MGVLFYIVVVAIILAVLFLMALIHAGYFSDIRIRTSIPLSLPGRVAYKLYRGSYTNAGAAFKELASVDPHIKTVGIYYDDPKKVRCESILATSPVRMVGYYYQVFDRWPGIPVCVCL